jgi:hypothetical protein
MDDRVEKIAFSVDEAAMRAGLTSTRTTGTVRASTGRRILLWHGRLTCPYHLFQVVLVVNHMKLMRKWPFRKR